MSDKYCGGRKVPKGKKRGTMKECVESGRISHWGVNRIDANTLKQLSQKGKKKPLTAAQIMIKRAGVGGKIKGVKKQLEYAKDPAIKKELQAKIVLLKAEYRDLTDQYNVAYRRENKIAEPPKKLAALTKDVIVKMIPANELPKNVTKKEVAKIVLKKDLVKAVSKQNWDKLRDEIQDARDHLANRRKYAVKKVKRLGGAKKRRIRRRRR